VVSSDGVLWIVATPIGTLGDLAPRARDVLADVDVILAEDTRRTRALLSYAGIAAGGRLRSFHEHNEEQRLPRVMADLEAGRSVALVSDAGTPMLSDPGYLLVREARREAIRICSVPGPSAFTAALAAAGQPPLPAVLVGFLPARRGARKRRLAELAGWAHTAVVLLSPHRIRDELVDLAEAFGVDRPATLLAELSKSHERAIAGELSELAACDEVARPRGEYVVVVGPRSDPPISVDTVDTEQVRDAYERALAMGEDRRSALKTVARNLCLGRREVYSMLNRGQTSERGDS
jgi:16S rRNA (cytidine1402-2'-O)-methyltransferase